MEKQYQGMWRSVASYLRTTLAETESETLRNRTIGFMHASTCPACGGRRLNPQALTVTYLDMPIDEFNARPLDELTDLIAAGTTDVR